MKEPDRKRIKIESSPNSTISRRSSSLSTLTTIEMTRQQFKCMKTVLHNPMILHKILNAMDYPQLKISRGVSPTWKQVSFEIMTKRDCSVVYLDVEDITKFYKILKKSKDFPCSNFEFSSDVDLSMSEVSKLFQHYHSKIKSLKFSSPLPCSEISDDDLCSILRLVAPNLTSLHLSNFKQEWFEEQNFYFEALKLFCYKNSPYTVMKVLQTAPKLETISMTEVTEEILNYLGGYGNMQMVKDFPLTLLSPNNLPCLRIFAEMGPKLIRMNLSSYFKIGKNSIQQILESSKDTLEHLIISDAPALDKMAMPKLSSLKTLEFIGKETNQLMPIFTNLTDTFPNLRVLNLIRLNPSPIDPINDNVCVGRSIYGGSFSTVKKLQINSSCTEKWMNWIAFNCPNFNQVEISNPNDYFDPTILTKIFNMWPHLEQLEIIPGALIMNFAMDSVMTGMSQEVCQQYWATYPEYREEKFQQIVNGPSIRDLKRLKVLKVHLYDRTKMPFSRLSGLYCFKMMANLKVVIIFDHDEFGFLSNFFYEELGPYGNIRHEKYKRMEEEEGRIEAK